MDIISKQEVVIECHKYHLMFLPECANKYSEKLEKAFTWVIASMLLQERSPIVAFCFCFFCKIQERGEIMRKLYKRQSWKGGIITISFLLREDLRSRLFLLLILLQPLLYYDPPSPGSIF